MARKVERGSASGREAEQAEEAESCRRRARRASATLANPLAGADRARPRPALSTARASSRRPARARGLGVQARRRAGLPGEGPPRCRAHRGPLAQRALGVVQPVQGIPGQPLRHVVADGAVGGVRAQPLLELRADGLQAVARGRPSGGLQGLEGVRKPPSASARAAIRRRGAGCRRRPRARVGVRLDHRLAAARSRADVAAALRRPRRHEGIGGGRRRRRAGGRGEQPADEDEGPVPWESLSRPRAGPAVPRGPLGAGTPLRSGDPMTRARSSCSASASVLGQGRRRHRLGRGRRRRRGWLRWGGDGSDGSDSADGTDGADGSDGGSGTRFCPNPGSWSETCSTGSVAAFLDGEPYADMAFNIGPDGNVTDGTWDHGRDGAIDNSWVYVWDETGFVRTYELFALGPTAEPFTEVTRTSEEAASSSSSTPGRRAPPPTRPSPTPTSPTSWSRWTTTTTGTVRRMTPAS